jgi:hypothetical protein
MNRSDVKELYFITYIENVPSILKRGILSHNIMSRNINFRDISESGVQERRAKKKIPGTNKSLHDYANLYFDAHNPMLSKRRSENDKICVLIINNMVLDIDGVIITDQNAARECWFKTVVEGLQLLNKEEIYTTFWIDNSDPIKEYKQKGIKCAEVLVPDCVSSDYIIGAYVANRVAFDNLCNLSDIHVIIKSELFF